MRSDQTYREISSDVFSSQGAQILVFQSSPCLVHGSLYPWILGHLYHHAGLSIISLHSLRNALHKLHALINQTRKDKPAADTWKAEWLSTQGLEFCSQPSWFMGLMN